MEAVNTDGDPTVTTEPENVEQDRRDREKLEQELLSIIFASVMRCLYLDHRRHPNSQRCIKCKDQATGGN